MTSPAGPRAPAPVVGVNLGAGPVPESATQWEQRIGDGVRTLLPDDDAADLAGQVQISVAAAGADLEQVRVDLTGLALTEEHRSLDLTGVDLTDVPPVGEAQPMSVRRLEVVARPMHLEGVPVTADLLAESVPVFLARDGADDLWALMDPDQAAAEMRGEGTFSVPLEQAIDRVRDIVAGELEKQGLTLKALEVQVQTPTPRAVVFAADARIRKGVMSASAQIRVEAQVDDQMAARIGRVQARSGNPLVSLLLTAVRSRLDRYTGTTIDLNAHMPPGLRLVDLSLVADGQLTAHARFA